MQSLLMVLSFNMLKSQRVKSRSIVNEGEFATRMGLTGIPNYSESTSLKMWLVRDTKCRYHVSHISTKESVEIIRKAKKEGLPITCDTATLFYVK